MSDATSVELGKIGAPEAADGTSVSEVLLEQVDEKVGVIEKQRGRLKPFQEAIVTTQSDLSKLQAASAASTNPAVKQVYARAVEVAIAIMEEVKKQGQEVSDQITKLQEELEKLLTQLRAEDPQNPLVKEL